MILHKPSRWMNLFADLCLRFSYLKEDLIIDCVSNFEIDKLNSVNVVLRAAQIIFGWLFQL